jgi:dTDP-4-amino-4,6-dideoxygalactose transaminase
LTARGDNELRGAPEVALLIWFGRIQRGSTQMNNHQINVTEPLLPPLQKFIPYLVEIWRRRWLTNGGHFHHLLETALAEYLQVPYVSLFNNGTSALLVALRALNISGEVITTPFSFVATAHSLLWAGLTPVFADIDPDTFNLDPHSVMARLSEQTGAIVPVHCYGTPCDVFAFQEISKSAKIPVMYDAAHAFGVKINGQSVLNFGDLSILSFHATKVFNTFEGGAIISHSKEQKSRIDNLKNFGIVDEITVVDCGINGKMSEFQAAFGLLQLSHVDEAIKIRKDLADHYRLLLKDEPRVAFLSDAPNVFQNGGYVPVLVHGDGSSTRDALFAALRSRNIGCRRYFYPLISNMEMYRSKVGAAASDLPVANFVADRVLCLPVHPNLRKSDVTAIVEFMLQELRGADRGSSAGEDWAQEHLYLLSARQLVMPKPRAVRATG